MALNDTYVSAAATGWTSGAAVHAGTASDPWQLDEAVGASSGGAADGDRVNILKGTYTLGAGLTFKSGTTAPIVYRGYNSSIGDLEDVGRATATAALTTTNFPVIDGGSTHLIALGANSQYHSIRFTSSRSTVMATASNAALYRCVVENTSAAGATAQALGGGGTCVLFYDCDLTVASSNNSTSVQVSNGSSEEMFYGCRIWNTTGGQANQRGIRLQVRSVVMNCIIFDLGLPIVMDGDSHVIGNTIYNTLGSGAVFFNTTGVGSVVGNIIYTSAGDGIDGLSGGEFTALFDNAMGGLTGNRIDTATIGTAIEETNPITLTGDPFTASGSDDYTLNNTAGAGALCRGASKLWGG